VDQCSGYDVAHQRFLDAVRVAGSVTTTPFEAGAAVEPFALVAVTTQAMVVPTSAGVTV
jgi:hypothetical protein